MKTFSGYSKANLGDSYILLAGGGEKALSELVDTTTALTISGVKTFSSELKLGTRVTSTAPSSETEVTRLTLVPYFHTGGPWYIKSADDSSSAFLKLYYGSTQLLKIKHDGTFMTTLKADITGSAGSIAWSNVSSKPASATRWPTWDEVTGKPDTFSPSSHTHSYLPLGGGTMTGPLKWKNGDALPERSSVEYVLSIDAFDNGGKTYWSSMATLKSSLGLGSAAYTNSSAYASSSHNHDGSYVPIVTHSSMTTWSPGSLDIGIHKIHRPGVEYSSIIQVQDYSGSKASLYFHPHTSYSNRIYYLKGSNSYELAYTSDIPTTISWNSITDKPSTYTPSSHTHTYIEAKGNYTFDSGTLPNSFDYGISAGFVNSNSGFGSYGSVLTVRTYSGGGGTLQLYAPYSPTYGGSRLKVRFGNYDSSSGNSWTGLKSVAYTDDLTWSSISGKPSTFTPSSHSHSEYLPRNTNSDVLPQFSGAPDYLLGIEAFASNGTIKWLSASSVNVGYASSSGNSDTCDGLHVHSGRNDNANKIVRTDSSGYMQCGWINTTSGGFNGANSGINKVYCSEDNYIRYLSKSDFISAMGLFTTSGGTVSGGLTVKNYGVSVTYHPLNSSWAHIYNDSGVNFIFNASVYCMGGFYDYNTGNSWIHTGNYSSYCLPLSGGTISAGGYLRFADGSYQLSVSSGNRLSVGSNGQSVALGLNVGSLLVSSAWADYTNVPTNGIWCKGSIYASNFYTTSDLRKKNIVSGSHYKVEDYAKIPLINFEWIDNPGEKLIGTIAQNVQDIIPELVNGEEYLSVNYGVLGTLAGVEACREIIKLRLEIKELKEKLNEIV